MCQQLSNLFHFTFNAAVAGHYQRIQVTFIFLLWMKANATKYVWPQCGCSSVLSPVPRRLQVEEQQLRTSSLPAIPNPFPELCSPASSPVLSPGSLPPGEPSTGNYVSQTLHITMLTFSRSYLGIQWTTKELNFLNKAYYLILLCIRICCGCNRRMVILFPEKTRYGTSADLNILLCLWLRRVTGAAPFEGCRIS